MTRTKKKHDAVPHTSPNTEKNLRKQKSEGEETYGFRTGEAGMVDNGDSWVNWEWEGGGDIPTSKKV